MFIYINNVISLSKLFTDRYDNSHLSLLPYSTFSRLALFQPLEDNEDIFFYQIWRLADLLKIDLLKKSNLKKLIKKLRETFHNCNEMNECSKKIACDCAVKNSRDTPVSKKKTNVSENITKTMQFFEIGKFFGKSNWFFFCFWAAFQAKITFSGKLLLCLGKKCIASLSIVELYDTSDPRIEWSCTKPWWKTSKFENIRLKRSKFQGRTEWGRQSWSKNTLVKGIEIPFRGTHPVDQKTYPCFWLQIFDQHPHCHLCILGSFWCFLSPLAGLNGILPQTNGQTGPNFLKAVTNLVKVILEGKVSSELRPFFSGAKTIALEKPDGGLRPKAV